ncbi:MAG: methylamine utilization MauE, partial [Deltaproteobacteria bacterium]|nr:methylamine utilization MauE [Deltaproteobacteria bacterium]
NAVALVLPWLEILLAAMLLCRIWMGSALILSNLLLAVFLAAIFSAHLRGIDLDCGCFSSSGNTTDDMRWYLIRDSAFLILGLATAWLEARRDASTKPAPTPQSAV